MANEGWPTPAVVPTLVYEDVPAAVEWLTKAFGFGERRDARITGQGFVLAWMDGGSGLVHLATAGGHELHSPRSQGAATGLVKVYVEGLDAHFAQAKSAGAEIVSVPEDGFWGGRIYRARDPEGHLWEFSEAGSDLPASEWRVPPGITRGA